MKLIWLLLGLVSLALGIIGAFLPLLPTVPLVLLSAFFFSKSSDRLHDWMLDHAVFGPWIRDWRENGGMSKRVKIYATASILVAFAIPFIIGLKAYIIAIQGVVLSGVLLYIWTRPTS